MLVDFLPETEKQLKHLMAVEARHLNLFPRQFILNRENVMNPAHLENGIDAYNQQQMRFQAMGNYNSFYQQLVCDSTQPKTSINSESGLTCNVPASRKRSRDSADAGEKFHKNSSSASFVGENIILQIHQYQFEIDALVTEHTKKIRLELQQRQKQHAKQLVATIGESMMKTLKEKDDQIQKMERLYLMLQEKVKTLYMENQLWRDLAQTKEATANYLRGKFELALAQAGGGGAAAEDVESCGSSETACNKDSERRCRRCGERQCSVLLLPCRHLCLCGVCGSGTHQLRTCPVCDSTMTATLHLNMS